MGSRSPGLLTPQQTLILELPSARFGLRSEEIARALYGQKAPQGAMNTIAVQLHCLVAPEEVEQLQFSATDIHDVTFR